jgi:hypothetical protein
MPLTSLSTYVVTGEATTVAAFPTIASTSSFGAAVGGVVNFCFRILARILDSNYLGRSGRNISHSFFILILKNHERKISFRKNNFYT